MALISTSNTTSGVMYDTPSYSNYVDESNCKIERTDEGNSAPKRLCTITATSKCYLVSQDKKLPQILQDAMNLKGCCDLGYTDV